MGVCDVTQCFPQDPMHVLLEGVCEISIRALLNYFIFEREIIDFHILNDRIENFDYKSFSKNKPALISDDHIARDGNLKQTASQIRTFLYTLPFILSEFVDRDVDCDHISCYVLLLQITNLCFA